MNKAQKTILILTMILLIIILTTTVLAVIIDDNGSPYSATSLRGERVDIYGGNGLYSYNTVEKALMMRAFDWYYLIGGIPVFIMGILYTKKRYRILRSAIFVVLLDL